MNQGILASGVTKATCLPEDLEGKCAEFRKIIKTISKSILNFKTLGVPDTADKGEVVANIMLSYRHLEDARMRLGKVLEAINGEGEFVSKKRMLNNF